MNKKNNLVCLILIFLLLFNLFSTAQSSNEKILRSHKTVAILPAFYFDASNASALSYTAQQYKNINEFKNELARDVQYKFYIPAMLQRQDYSVFFRGADTINQLLLQNNYKLKLPESIDYRRIAEILHVDAIIILELAEHNKIKAGDLVSIFLTFTNPAQNTLGKISDIYSMNSIFTNQSVALTLSAKIYDCKSEAIVWINRTNISNTPYHTAINKMVEKLLKKIPYRLHK